MAGKLIFISGGVRSGKSNFAEQVAIKLAADDCNSLHYIATGKRSDAEMEERIARHEQDRRQSGYRWKTWEQPTNLAAISDQFGPNDVILIDCLTTLLNNEFFQLKEDFNDERLDKMTKDILHGIEQLANQSKACIVVSNEVLNEPIGDYPLVVSYGRALGRLHQLIVAKASEAYLVESSVPIILKGTI